MKGHESNKAKQLLPFSLANSQVISHCPDAAWVLFSVLKKKKKRKRRRRKKGGGGAGGGWWVTFVDFSCGIFCNPKRVESDTDTKGKTGSERSNM